MKILNTNTPPLISKLPAFEGHNLHIRKSNRILKSITDLNKQEYEKMSFLSKFILRQNTPKRLEELAKCTCNIAFKIKNRCDELYGKNNYMIIAVGRSVASIAEAIKFMGGESKVIPLSDLPYSLPSRIRDIKMYSKYLKQIGLTQELIKENPDKKFILIDYIVSGNSLDNSKKFLERPELLGESDNFVSGAINSFINNTKIYTLFFYERFKNFSPVGQLTLDNLKDVKTQSDSKTSCEGRGNVCQYLRNLFLFNLLQCISKDNFHKCRARKEIRHTKRINAIDEREYYLLDKMYYSTKNTRFDK